MLSVIINVKNGERLIKKVLESLVKFEDVIVYDNYSVDNTIKIANEFSNVRVFEEEFKGMGAARNNAATKAKYDWIFYVDSDEIVSLELANYLLNCKLTTGNIYTVKRRNYFDNYFLNASGWGNDWVKRIFNRKETQYNNKDVHESVNKGNCKIIKIKKGCIYHFPYENMSELIDKMQVYSYAYAKQNYKKKQVSLMTIPFRSLLMFLKYYFLQRGFLNGYEGFVISSYNAIGVFVKYMKLYELSQKQTIALAVYIKNFEELSFIIDSINEQKLLPKKVYIIIDDELKISKEYLSKIKQIQIELIVESNIIFNFNQDIGTIINNSMIKDDFLNIVIFVEDNLLLKQSNFFKKCKKAILNGYNIDKVEIFNN